MQNSVCPPWFSPDQRLETTVGSIIEDKLFVKLFCAYVIAIGSVVIFI